GTVLPVLVLTGVVAVLCFAGRQPSGPDSASFFSHIGWVAAIVIPLILVSAGLVGNSLRERSARYAFAAGLVVNVAVTGGYALGIVTVGEQIGPAESVRMFQLYGLTAAVWALLWLASWPWVRARREGQEAPLSGPLMRCQIGMAILGNAVLLLGGL